MAALRALGEGQGTPCLGGPSLAECGEQVLLRESRARIPRRRSGASVRVRELASARRLQNVGRYRLRLGLRTARSAHLKTKGAARQPSRAASFSELSKFE